MKRYSIILILIAFGVNSNLCAQNSVPKDSINLLIDSLRSEFNKETVKLDKIKLALRIGKLYSDQQLQIEARDYFLSGLDLARKLKDKYFECIFLRQIGRSYAYSGDYRKAIEFFNLEAAEIPKVHSAKNRDSLHVDNLFALGVAYRNLEEYTIALPYLLKCMRYFENESDSTKMVYAVWNIADIYSHTDSIPKALELLGVGQKYCRTTYDSIMLCEIEASALSLSGNYHEALEKYESIHEYYNNIHDSYFAISTLINIINLRNDFFNCYKNIDYALPFLSKCDSINALSLKRELTLSLSKSYECLGDFRNAMKYMKEFINIDALINSSKKISDFAQLEAKKKSTLDSLNAVHSLELKSVEVVKEKEEKVLKERQLLIAIVSLIVILITLIVLYNRFNLTRKQKKIIEVQKSTVENAHRLMEEKNKEITDSINYAKRIQYTLLAHDEFLSQNLPNHFVLFKPKDIVSGDFYWATKITNTGTQMIHEGVVGDTRNKAYQIPTDTFFLSVCDSTGHGVPGAFMSLLNISFLNEAISERKILKPNEILDYVRMRLVESVSQNGGKDGMDGILISKSDDIIHYAAANNAPILISDGKIKELNKDKMPVGYGERKQNFSLNEVNYQKGDILYLYTDGFADQFGGEKGKKYKYKQLNEFLSSISTLSMDEQRVKLDEEFHRWKGELEQVDDVCVIGIRL